jgi:hypothetical protein
VKPSLFSRIAVLAVVGALVFSPSLSQAGGQTLKRSVGNLTQFPLDILLSPIQAGNRLNKNLKAEDDPMALKVVMVVPGWLFLTGNNAFGAMMRGFAGIAELPAGLFLLTRKDAEMYPLFPITERGGALWDKDTKAFHFMIGIDYAGGNVNTGGGFEAR